MKLTPSPVKADAEVGREQACRLGSLLPVPTPLETSEAVSLHLAMFREDNRAVDGSSKSN